MQIKQIIKDWLGIKEIDYRYLESLIDEKSLLSEKKLDNFMKKYHPAECAYCKKQILAHYGGFYRSAEGEVHCSYDCIYKHHPNLKK